MLTDAPLVPTGRPIELRCGKCTEYVEICPVQAITGRPFSADEPREARFDAAFCDQYFREPRTGGGPSVCGFCLFVCPHGRKEKSAPKSLTIPEKRIGQVNVTGY